MNLQFCIRRAIFNRIELVYIDRTILVMVPHSNGWGVHVRIEPRGTKWVLVGGEHIYPRRIAEFEMDSEEEAITWAVRSLGHNHFTFGGKE